MNKPKVTIVNQNNSSTSPVACKNVSISPTMCKATPEDVLAMYADRSRKYAEEIKQIADEISKKIDNFVDFDGNFSGVKDLTEEDGVITIYRTDGTEKVIKLVKSVNGEYADENGNVVLPKEIEIIVLGDSKV